VPARDTGFSTVGLGAVLAPRIAGEPVMGRPDFRFGREFRGECLAAPTGTWVSVFDPLSWRDALAARAVLRMGSEL
jgi:hypothetical protein